MRRGALLLNLLDQYAQQPAHYSHDDRTPERGEEAADVEGQRQSASDRAGKPQQPHVITIDTFDTCKAHVSR